MEFALYRERTTSSVLRYIVHTQPTVYTPHTEAAAEMHVIIQRRLSVDKVRAIYAIILTLVQPPATV